MCTSMTRGVKAEEGHPRPTRIYTRYSSTSPTLAWLQLVAHPVGTRTALPASHLYSGLGASLAGSQSRHPRGGTRQAALSARTTVPVVLAPRLSVAGWGGSSAARLARLGGRPACRG